MILYIGICKQVTRKILGLINESGKVAGYKTNAQKSLAFLYIIYEISEREIMEIITFTTATKNNKILRAKATY